MKMQALVHVRRGVHHLEDGPSDQIPIVAQREGQHRLKLEVYNVAIRLVKPVGIFLKLERPDARGSGFDSSLFTSSSDWLSAVCAAAEGTCKEPKSVKRTSDNVNRLITGPPVYRGSLLKLAPTSLVAILEHSLRHQDLAGSAIDVEEPESRHVPLPGSSRPSRRRVRKSCSPCSAYEPGQL